MAPQTKTEKMHLRLTEDIAREVRALADLEHRPVQDQMRFLIVLGLQTAKVLVHGHDAERRRTVTPDDSVRGMQGELPLTPIAAKRRPMPQAERKRA